MITVKWFYKGEKETRKETYENLEECEWWFNNCFHFAAVITDIESDDSDENEQLEWYKTKIGLNDTPTL